MPFSPRLFRALGWCACVIASVSLLFMALAWLDADRAGMQGFFFSFMVSAFLGGIALAGTQGVSSAAGASAALRLSLLGWIFVPILAAPPLVIASDSVSVGIFEAYSAMTTTGAIVMSPEEIGWTIVLWRCVLAWMGGLTSLVLASTVFAALDRRGVGLRRTSLLTVERSDLFTNFGRAFQRLGLVYSILTGVGVFALMLTGTPPFDAVCLAMSGISTAGLQGHDGPLSEILNVPGVMILTALCLCGAWNMAVQYEAITRLRTTRGSGELRAMLVIAMVFGVIGLVLFGPSAFATSAIDALFAVTTSGFQTAPDTALPVATLIFLALLGGSTISTAGGIKMPRILLLLRRAGGELSVLSHPSAAIRTRYAGRAVSDEALAGVWVYALSFPVALGLGGVLLGMTGAGFEQAWTLSAAALTNTGPIARDLWPDQNPVTLLWSAPLMVLGRLEILAAVAALYVMASRD